MSTNDWCYQLLYIYIQQTEEKEARGQTDTKTSTPANGVLKQSRMGVGYKPTEATACAKA